MSRTYFSSFVSFFVAVVSVPITISAGPPTAANRLTPREVQTIHSASWAYFHGDSQAVLEKLSPIVARANEEKIGLVDKALAELGSSLVSNQVHYSLLRRSIETNGVLEAAKELGISIIAYSPLEQGVLSGKFHDDGASTRRPAGLRKYPFRR